MRVSTHSRPKAAGFGFDTLHYIPFVSTHSRPKAAGLQTPRQFVGILGFNTQPPEGGWKAIKPPFQPLNSFNTQPPEGGWVIIILGIIEAVAFQHTAARRRLVRRPKENRPKAAFQHTAARRRLGLTKVFLHLCLIRFNTQPPEGGWSLS